MNALVGFFYIAFVAYVAVLDIISLIHINDTYGLGWLIVTVLSGVGLLIAPFVAGLGWWYAPALVIGAVFAALKERPT